MAIENINVGSAPNDGTGLTLRDAFIVVNGNFAQIDTKSEVDAKIISAINPLLVRISEVEGDIEQINTELDTLSTISYVDAQIQMVSSNLDVVDNKVNLINTDLTALTFRVENIETILPTKLSDAPSDNKIYGRSNGAWVEVTGGGTIDAYTKAESNALFSTKTETNTLDAQNVKISGNQSISGVKTFSASPIVPTPTSNTQATNKSYVDTAISTKANQSEITRIDNELTAKANTTTVNTLDAQNVKISGNQTVAGIKTFSSSPIVPTATVNTQAVNKGQMDAAIAAGGGDLSNYYTKAQTDTEIEDAISNLHTIVSAEIITEVTKSRRITVSTGTATVASTWSKCLIICTVNTLITIPNNPGVIDFWVKAANGVTVTFASSGSNISPNSTGTTISSKNMGFVYCANQNHTITEFATGGSTGDDNVKLTGNQTVAGVKTFSTGIKAPVATAFDDVVIKQQMDSELAGKVNKTYFSMFEAETEADIIALESNVSSLQGSVSSLDSRVSSVEGQLPNKVDNSTFSALNNNVVKLSGNQAMNGVKTFNNSPIVPVPTTAFQASTKSYVDNSITAALSNRINISSNTTVDESYRNAIVFVTDNAVITIPSTLGFIDFVVKCNATSTATFAMGSGSTLDASSTGLIVEPKGMASVITYGSTIIITGGV